MSESEQQKDVEGCKPETVTIGQKVEVPKADASLDDQKVPRESILGTSKSEALIGSVGGIKAGEENAIAAGNHDTIRSDFPAVSVPASIPMVKVEPASTRSTETQPLSSESKQTVPATIASSAENASSAPSVDTASSTPILDSKAENHQVAMLASVKAAQKELGQTRPATEVGQGKSRLVAKGKELKCKSCKRCKDERIPVAIFQPMESGRSVAIKISPQCGHACTIVINNAFEITEHVCTSYIEIEAVQVAPSDFDFDRFIEGGEELDDFLLKQKTRQAGKLVSLEDQMKVAVKKLVKPLAILVPTAVQRKSEAQLRAEREDRLRQIVEIEANMVYLRVLEFEKVAIGGMSYPIDKLSKILKDLDKKYITGFIQKVNNDFLISYNEKTQTVRFYSPSKPEVEILSREFEKWLRFNRL